MIFATIHSLRGAPEVFIDQLSAGDRSNQLDGVIKQAIYGLGGAQPKLKFP